MTILKLQGEAGRDSFHLKQRIGWIFIRKKEFFLISKAFSIAVKIFRSNRI
jgi:hypothetical protein